MSFRKGRGDVTAAEMDIRDVYLMRGRDIKSAITGEDLGVSEVT